MPNSQPPPDGDQSAAIVRFVHALTFWPAADEALTRIEQTGDDHALGAVRRTLGMLEADPFSPRLRTRQFDTPEYGHIRMTPCGHANWHVYWLLGDEGLEIAAIGNPE